MTQTKEDALLFLRRNFWSFKLTWLSEIGVDATREVVKSMWKLLNNFIHIMKIMLLIVILFLLKGKFVPS